MGTIANCIAIIIGGLLGISVGRKMPEGFQSTLLSANGVAVMFIGISGTMQQMLTISNSSISLYGTMMMILSLAIGALIGEWWNLEGKAEKFGTYLKIKTHNSSDPTFVQAFVNASLTVCIGAMAIVGAIEEGTQGNAGILYAKAVLDFVIILVMSAGMGKGCIFSFLPVGILQGSVTLLARLLSPLIAADTMRNLSLVGNILVFCVGINLVFGKKVKVANLLPSLIVAIVFSYLPFNL